MTQAVLLGDPSFFRIQAGSNPHTRTLWGACKRVNGTLAKTQWNELKLTLQDHGVQVHVLPAVEGLPGLVFPANAGLKVGGVVYLSNLNPARAPEKEHYRKAFAQIGVPVEELPCSDRFEGEADFIPVGDPSGDGSKRLFLFTYGPIEDQRWVPRFGFPPYRRVYGFRSDRRVLSTLQTLVGKAEVLALELVDEAHYHGDTVLCPFGDRGQYLLAYLEALSPRARWVLQSRLGDRIVPLSRSDGRRFAANSFQIFSRRHGVSVPVLLMPDGLSLALYNAVRTRGVVPCPVNVSEFLEKGGGAVKCMLFNLGDS